MNKARTTCLLRSDHRAEDHPTFRNHQSDQWEYRQRFAVQLQAVTPSIDPVKVHFTDPQRQTPLYI